MSMRAVFKEAAKNTGATVVVVHSDPLLMKLTFADGVSFHVHGKTVPLISKQGLLKNKYLTAKILMFEGLPSPRTHLIRLKAQKFPDRNALEKSKDYPAIKRFIQEVGWPVYLKPNKGSQGRHVFRVRDHKILDRLLVSMAKRNEDFVIQQECKGPEYRVILVRGEIALAYRRHPLEVLGDGRQTLDQLIKVRLYQLRLGGRKIKLRANSSKISTCLADQLMTRALVPLPGQVVTIIANNNLSDGALPLVCTDEIREKYSDLFQQMYSRLNIEYCGVDLKEVVQSGVVTPSILEINGTPAYHHFIKSDLGNFRLVADVMTQCFHAAYNKWRDLQPTASVNDNAGGLPKPNVPDFQPSNDHFLPRAQAG